MKKAFGPQPTVDLPVVGRLGPRTPMLKLATFAVLLLVFGSNRGGACSIVELPTEVTPEIKVRVMDGGKPAKSVAVSLVPTGKPALRNALTDGNGWVKFSKLASGIYEIHAGTAHGAEGVLFVRVTETAAKRPSVVMLPLWDPKAQPSELPPAPQVQVPEQEPTKLAVKQLTARVLDPAGAVIPAARVWIIPKNTTDPKRTIKLQTDERGHFEAALPDGLYSVIVLEGGFKTNRMTFEVRSTADDKEVPITLAIGSAC
jgi:Carboxypeptidase regulatory-like domain